MITEELRVQEHLNILLVDDDVVDREAIKRALVSRRGSQTIKEAVTVDEAMSYLKQIKFDVILLDYKMPQRDGIELLFELQKHSHQHDNAIIMMSTTDDESIILKCLAAGAHDFISKSALSALSLRRSIFNSQIRLSLEKQLKASYIKVKQLAETDHLTGLHNRYAFDSYLKRKSVEVLKLDSILALLLIDLDHFKVVNDSYGHDTGDQLLSKFAKRLEKVASPTAFIARIGGDEFGVILSGEDCKSDAIRLASDLIASMSKPLRFKGKVESLTVSIGMAIIPDNSDSAISAFKHADMAVYAAKNEGRNQYQAFQQWMKEDIIQKTEMEKDLRAAIQNKQFELYYQPIFESGKKSALVGFEALIRWNKGRLIAPEEFIAVAEESKLIKSIGRWVIKQAIKQISIWNKRYQQKLKMSINLSAVQLEDSKLVACIEDSVKKYQIPFNQIEFELTETTLLDSTSPKVEKLMAISELGCSLALDDFGTGFSSFTHLKNFPIDVVKIDKSLLPIKDDDLSVYRLFKGMCGMIHSLNLKVTVEGVEQNIQLELCQTLAVDYVQGFLLSKPNDAQTIEQKYLC